MFYNILFFLQTVLVCFGETNFSLFIMLAPDPFNPVLLIVKEGGTKWLPLMFNGLSTSVTRVSLYNNAKSNLIMMQLVLMALQKFEILKNLGKLYRF